MDDVNELSEVEVRAILGMLATRHPKDADEIAGWVFNVTRKDA